MDCGVVGLSLSKTDGMITFPSLPGVVDGFSEGVTLVCGTGDGTGVDGLLDIRDGLPDICTAEQAEIRTIERSNANFTACLRGYKAYLSFEYRQVAAKRLNNM